jgi:pimeloyl-ACP methyl ester carboxylesterase
MIDRGSGVPVVLVPGIQGRWEWMAPAVDALAERCRVITFSLCDEPSSGFADRGLDGVNDYVNQIGDALDRAGISAAVLIGVSYSGLIAAEFAARRPERVLGLVLSSALPPDWKPDPRARWYLRAPLALSPVFLAAAPWRMMPEVAAALPALGARVRFSCRQATCLVRAHLSPTRMASRVRRAAAHNFADPAQIRVPTLVLTGEDGLDRVVPPEQTRQYLSRIGLARHVVLRNTGHLGLVTKPQEYAATVAAFAEEIAGDAKRIPA